MIERKPENQNAMSHERPARPAHPSIHEVFGLDESERLDSRVSHERLQAILNSDQTSIHTIKESCNNYGEFLFVTVSRPAAQECACMTFFGLGFHEYRERWFTDEWFWYRAHPFSSVIERTIAGDEALRIIQQRLESISPYVGQGDQTGRGRLFEMLADLTDEDGAWAELQDLDDLADRLGAEAKVEESEDDREKTRKPEYHVS